MSGKRAEGKDDPDPEVFESAPGSGATIVTSTTEKAKAIMAGFRINLMSLANAETHEVLWSARDWTAATMAAEVQAYIPKRILDCTEVSRKVIFHSDEKIDDFWLQQVVYLDGMKLEEMTFKFGFVIPNSTNEWEQLISKAPDAIPAELMSGKIVFETSFLDGENLIAKSAVRIYYT